ncbi:unnamed protein product [Amoebophrya sp. A120]|nr:unnamed protein product [Amoebophrya sp. A120]|eukprot:GSA120T00025890001.1
MLRHSFFFGGLSAVVSSASFVWGYKHKKRSAYAANAGTDQPPMPGGAADGLQRPLLLQEGGELQGSAAAMQLPQAAASSSSDTATGVRTLIRQVPGGASLSSGAVAIPRGKLPIAVSTTTGQGSQLLAPSALPGAAQPFLSQPSTVVAPQTLLPEAEDHDLASLVDHYRDQLRKKPKNAPEAEAAGDLETGNASGPLRRRRRNNAAAAGSASPTSSETAALTSHQQLAPQQSEYTTVMSYTGDGQQGNAASSTSANPVAPNTQQCGAMAHVRRRSGDLSMAALRFSLEESTRDAYIGVSAREKVRRIGAFLRNDIMNGKIVATMSTLALGHIMASLVEPELQEKPVVGSLINLGFSIPFYFVFWLGDMWNTWGTPKLQTLKRKYGELEAKVGELKVVRDNLRKWRNNVEWIARGERYGLYDDGANDITVQQSMAELFEKSFPAPDAASSFMASTQSSVPAMPSTQPLQAGIAAYAAAAKGFPHKDAKGNWIPNEFSGQGLDPSRESWFKSLGEHTKTELRTKMRAYRRRVQHALALQTRLSGEVQEEFYFQLALIDELRSRAVGEYLQECQQELDEADSDSDSSSNPWEHLTPDQEEELQKMLDGCSDRTKLSCLRRSWRRFWACGTAPTKAADGEHNFYTLQQDLYPVDTCALGCDENGGECGPQKDDGSELVWAGEKSPLSMLAKVRAKETLATLDLIEKALDTPDDAAME